MITEDYVSFEVAKLLKKKGVDIETNTYYYATSEYTKSEMYKSPNNTNWNINKYYCSAPTHQMAMKYLREVYHLHISVDVNPIYGKVKDEKGRNTCSLLYWHYMASGEWMNDKYNPQQKVFVVSEKSYKQAVEAAIKYSLENLI